MGYRSWLFVLAFTTAAWISAASAAVLYVDTTADDLTKSACDDTVAADCSLRGAIVRANGLAESSTIFVPAGTYSLTTASACPFLSHQWGSYFFTTASLCFQASVTLIGDGADVTIIDVNQLDRVVHISDGAAVEIRGVTLRHGSAVSGAHTAMTTGGGAIYNAGVLTLSDTWVTDNFTPQDGGIYNDNALTLIRSRIFGNTAAGIGGGVANMAFNALTTLTIQDTTIALNQSSTSIGGGVMNFGGIVAIAGSAIYGNSAAGTGGGVENTNNSAAMQIVNSTISGNTSGSCGGGLHNNSPNPIVLNNVTVTDNLSGATRSGGCGGGISGGGFTLSNTVVAGNRGDQPDCAAVVASKGYNLIQTTIPTCAISGDTNGNITGQDAKLGALADNGGWTLTHAIGQNSPAFDAGNPAATGSGGSACAALDQRGFPRPLGARCDMGAVEHSGAFSITRIQPSSGGNLGAVTALVSGNGFTDGSTVTLTRAGASDIVGTPAQVDNGGSAISATFDLRGAAAGPWNVVVTKPDATTQTLANGFAVQTGGSVDVWIDVPPFRLPRHGSVRITIFYGNRGTIDAVAVPLQLSVSSQYGLSTLFAVTPPPSQPDQILVGYDQVSVNLQPADDGYINLPLILPIVPAGSVGTLQVLLQIPQPPPTNDSTFFVNIDTPYFLPAVSTPLVSQLVAGATGFSSASFHVDVDPATIPGLQQYVINQLQQLVENGRRAFVASLGTSPQIYSHAQLVVDTAVVAAWRTLHP